jgi:probable rRNA maturation factor
MPKTSSPKIDLMLVRRPGAPARPGKEHLIALFRKAWTRLPAARRPELPGQQGQSRIAVDLLIVDDAEIESLNAAHLKERGPTDVLSFPMGEMDLERGAYHLGEIVVSFDTAVREAEARGLALDNELSRYCVHGFLHLLGYDDQTAPQQKEMFEMQEAVLK